jgi:hypothetical protein
MIVGSFGLSVVENEDFGPLVFTYYPAGQSSPPFDFTGYVASMMVRDSAGDAPVLTITPVLGGAAGTLSISISAAQCLALVSSLPSLTGYYDILLTAPSGTKTYFIGKSPFSVQRSVTL